QVVLLDDVLAGLAVLDVLDQLPGSIHLGPPLLSVIRGDERRAGQDNTGADQQSNHSHGTTPSLSNQNSGSERPNGRDRLTRPAPAVAEWALPAGAVPCPDLGQLTVRCRYSPAPARARKRKRPVIHGGKANAASGPRRNWLRKSRAERPCCQHVRHTDISTD